MENDFLWIICGGFGRGFYSSHLRLAVVSSHMSAVDNNVPEQNKMFQNKIKIFLSPTFYFVLKYFVLF
jgi:hypothetical protein